ncbi:MAG: hypothetical protein NTU98_07480 [Bacteroidetes bacterium]|nr:hypothetical protein [Bacteroidota bacterium]
MKDLQKIVLIILLLALVVGQKTVTGQEKKDTVSEITPDLKLGYLNTSNDSITLTADIFVKRETGNFALQNAEVEFTASADKENKSLGKAKADVAGTAVLKLYVKSGLPVDKEGKTTFTVSFAGKDKYLAASGNVAFKKAKILVTFTKEDTIRTIHVKAVQVEANNEQKPIKGETVNVYVPRMLSNLKIGEVKLDDNGTGTVEYPGALVGDSLGNIAVIAMIEESDLYGTVKGQSTISWGIPKQYYLAEKPSTRELWTPIAPIWMIITLIIMLTGVWGHYIYAVVQLIMIKRQSKQKKDYF